MIAAGGLWAVALVVAAVLGPLPVAFVLVAVVTVAVASGLRTCQRRSRLSRHVPIVVAIAASLTVLAGLGGPVPFAVALFVAAGVTIGTTVATSGKGDLRPLRRSLLLACGPAAGAGAVVVLAQEDHGLAVIMIVGVCLFDAASFLVGDGASVGIFAALVGCFSSALFVALLAAVVPNPLAGRPFTILGALLVIGAPLGVGLARRAASGERLPALRRIDSLIVVGPAWVMLYAVLLSH